MRSGRGGGKEGFAGGGAFLAHLDEANPLHFLDGRLRITVVSARNLPRLPGGRGSGRNGRKRQERAPAFVSMHFADGPSNASISSLARSSGNGHSQFGVQGLTRFDSLNVPRDLPAAEDQDMEEGGSWGGKEGYRWMNIARGRTRRVGIGGGATARGGGVPGIDNVWETPLEDMDVETRVSGWKNDPVWNYTVAVYLEVCYCMCMHAHEMCASCV